MRHLICAGLACALAAPLAGQVRAYNEVRDHLPPVAFGAGMAMPVGKNADLFSPGAGLALQWTLNPGSRAPVALRAEWTRWDAKHSWHEKTQGTPGGDLDYRYKVSRECYGFGVEWQPVLGAHAYLGPYAVVGCGYQGWSEDRNPASDGCGFEQKGGVNFSCLGAQLGLGYRFTRALGVELRYAQMHVASGTEPYHGGSQWGMLSVQGLFRFGG